MIYLTQGVAAVCSSVIRDQQEHLERNSHHRRVLPQLTKMTPKLVILPSKLRVPIKEEHPSP